MMSKRRIQRRRRSLIVSTAVGVTVLAGIAFVASDVLGVAFVVVLCLVALSAGRLERIEVLVPLERRIELLEKGVGGPLPPPLDKSPGFCRWCSEPGTHKVRTLVFDLAGTYRGEQSCFACDQHVGAIGVGMDLE